MKKNSILFLLLFFSFGFAQTYEFDFLTKYISENSKNKFTRDLVSYHNSDDFSYYLKLKKSDADFTATLYDHQRNLAHNFSVLETKIGGEIQFQFLYINSSKLAKTSDDKNSRYEFSEISETSPKTISLKIYPSKRAKNPISENTITLEKANKNLIPVFRSEWFHLYGKNDNVSALGNYIVSESIEKYKNYTCAIKLKEYKNVDLTITLPQELK